MYIFKTDAYYYTSILGNNCSIDFIFAYMHFCPPEILDIQNYIKLNQTVYKLPNAHEHSSDILQVFQFTTCDIVQNCVLQFLKYSV